MNLQNFFYPFLTLCLRWHSKKILDKKNALMLQ
jgi:hypothetical protein